MPSRQSGLPEGTDHIIDTNIELGDDGKATVGGGGTSSPGDNASKAKETKAGGSAFQFDADNAGNGKNGGGIGSQVREQLSTLKGQAGEKAREYADDGKGKASELLQALAGIVADATGSVEERLGGQYAGAGRKTSDAIQSLAGSLDRKSVDDLIDDARSFVQRSPAVAIGIAAVIGFAVARVVRSSVSEYRGDTSSADANTGRGGGDASSK